MAIYRQRYVNKKIHYSLIKTIELYIDIYLLCNNMMHCIFSTFIGWNDDIF